ncbi:MAG: hypothetical protein QNJ16_12520 [Rhodobacter sp.]|nr:hypothetical protein [Rhodobacter sp.]
MTFKVALRWVCTHVWKPYCRLVDRCAVVLVITVIVVYYAVVGLGGLLTREERVCSETAHDFQVEYTITGHAFTVGILANYAELDKRLGESNADLERQLVFYAQAPDAYKYRYMAFPAPQLKLLHNPTEAKRLLRVLHALHGMRGEALQKRRDHLRKALIWHLHSDEAKSNPEPWKIGLLLHAYADTFSHTCTFCDQETAYGPVLGHVYWPSADKIGKYPEKFKRYTKTTLSALTLDDTGAEKLDRLLSRIDEIARDGGSEADIRAYLGAEYAKTGYTIGAQECRDWNQLLRGQDVSAFLGDVIRTDWPDLP